jgi:hypothetical protein
LEPRFLLHTMEEPQVDGNRIIARHKGGRLTATVLLPTSPRIEKIGGPGREFAVDGVNYPLNRPLIDRYTPGAWRVEIAGGTGAKRRFVTLLVPTDIDAPPEPEAMVEESADDGLTVRQGELSVAFTRSRQTASKGGRFISMMMAESPPRSA